MRRGFSYINHEFRLILKNAITKTPKLPPIKTPIAIPNQNISLSPFFYKDYIQPNSFYTIYAKKPRTCHTVTFFTPCGYNEKGGFYACLFGEPWRALRV